LWIKGYPASDEPVIHKFAHARYQVTHKTIRPVHPPPRWLPATFAQASDGLISPITFNLEQDL